MCNETKEAYSGQSRVFDSGTNQMLNNLNEQSENEPLSIFMLHFIWLQFSRTESSW